MSLRKCSAVITIGIGLVITVGGFLNIGWIIPPWLIAMWVGMLLVEQGRREWDEPKASE